MHSRRTETILTAEQRQVCTKKLGEILVHLQREIDLEEARRARGAEIREDQVRLPDILRATHATYSEWLKTLNEGGKLDPNALREELRGLHDSSQPWTDLPSDLTKKILDLIEDRSRFS